MSSSAIQADQNVEDIRQQLLDRSRVGVRKYGMTTTGANLPLHTWLQHAIEELLDGAVYLRQIQRETEGRAGLQDYLRLSARYHEAMDLIAGHEVKIANQAAEIERLKQAVSDGATELLGGWAAGSWAGCRRIKGGRRDDSCN